MKVFQRPVITKKKKLRLTPLFILDQSSGAVTLGLCSGFGLRHPHPTPSVCRLEIWPGYVTSVLQYENDITLCADISHKLFRMETAYDVIMRIREEARRANINVKERAAKELVGSVVFTR